MPEFRWPTGVGVLLATLVLLLLLIAVLFFPAKLSASLLAGCIIGLSVAIIFR